ncbi:hypothetical protein [Virgibacillus ndiopensis]|uniref:hypothetical protein n=1 Tax=Virgibacillus ndiopensis TaxID=2004408 RepID=UPI000C07D102|nr:hypothetical protein [Virgibacillus ndiopensis]
MTYVCNTKHQTAFQFIILVFLVQGLNDTEHSFLVFTEVLLCLFIVASFFLQYRLNINENSLSYQIALLNIPIYKKEISADQIKRFNFKRYSWSTRGAIIQLERGMNIRIIAFTPIQVYKKLVDFANTNNVSISKSKDYHILEKLRSKELDKNKKR